MMSASSTPTPPPLQRSFSKGNALLHMRSLLFTMVIITTVIWNNSVVNGAPAKLDTLVRPFPADLQPPLIEVDEKNAFDSYGNPIESLKPIQTPDGRKVISAQGLQFEIPNYASGITELKKPSDDLLPPFIARFETPASTTAVSPPASNGDSLQKVPLSADRESFPPFNTANGLAPVPTKTTFSKSEDGKVITNNIFLSGAVASGATGATQSTTSKYFGTTNAGNTISKDTFGSTSGFVKPSTVSTNFNQLTTSGAASGFVTASSTSGFTSSAATTVGGGVGSKYTGGFGGPPGVLAAQGGSGKPSGFATATSTAFTQSYNKASTNRTPVLATTTAGNLSGKFTGSFGGPPGVLRPYDNIKTV